MCVATELAQESPRAERHDRTAEIGNGGPPVNQLMTHGSLSLSIAEPAQAGRATPGHDATQSDLTDGSSKAVPETGLTAIVRGYPRRRYLKTEPCRFPSENGKVPPPGSRGSGSSDAVGELSIITGRKKADPNGGAVSVSPTPDIYAQLSIVSTGAVNMLQRPQAMLQRGVAAGFTVGFLIANRIGGHFDA
ncbi:hypothetical protein ZHAS_00013112 [Anopheles sinensis]|uniref:Uncharacterized protein n=1 Tax=Anopheles sinensis TaxID=74873 RepID=A0A084W4L2_ANOSI|nr:hypothetical protein ZHAS_00013112 [Anopheles sinensis]